MFVTLVCKRRQFGLVRWYWPVLMVVLLGGCADRPPLKLAAQVDLDRMYGGWYIVATIPNLFEKGLVKPYDVYAPRRGGDIRETFYMQRGSFSAPRRAFEVHDWVRPDTGNAHWRVQIFWPVNLPFLLIYVDPTYRYALFGEENRQLGWIYARSPDIPDSDFRDLLTKFAAAGYRTDRFLKFIQKPADIGRPGYWSAGVRPDGDLAKR